MELTVDGRFVSAKFLRLPHFLLNARQFRQNNFSENVFILIEEWLA